MYFIDPDSRLAGSSRNILTDGKTDCAYRDLPDIFECLDRLMQQHGVSTGGCLAVQCENTVPSAVLLLFLLERGYGFLINARTDTPLRNSPPMCRFMVIPEHTANESGLLTAPDQWLNIVSNPQWTGSGSFDPPGKLLLKTSGSTGAPKMAVLPREGLRGNARSTMERLQLTSADRVALPVPLFHSFGLTTAFLSAVAAGASIDLQKGANLLRYLQRERAFHPTTAFMTPIFCETLVKGRRGPRPYRLTVSAGDRFRGDVFRRYEGLCGCLVNLYGSTEMGAMSAGSPDDPFAARSQSAGRPMSGVELRVTAPDTGDTDVGEIQCRSRYGFIGYIDEHGEPVGINPLDHEGWFGARDLGRIRSDGCVEVFGRSDHTVNRDGLLVFFADVEKAISAIEGVDSAVVMAHGEGNRGKGLTAFCVLSSGSGLNAELIRKKCFEILPRRAVPDRIELIRSLPLLANGKIDRMKLIRPEK